MDTLHKDLHIFFLADLSYLNVHKFLLKFYQDCMKVPTIFGDFYHLTVPTFLVNFYQLTEISS